MLALFDIDGTLLSTDGAGMRAIEAAGRELFGPACHAHGVSFAGRLDPLIMRDMLANAGLAPTPDRLRAFRAAYERHMHETFREKFHGRVMPGVQSLLEQLDRVPGLTLGLLTGNFEPTGLLKVRSCGIDTARFHVSAWGDDSPHDPPERKHLPPVAVQRYRQKNGRDPRKVFIIGDTPHDVSCAKAHGHVAIAVATGKFSRAELLACGADHAFEDFSDSRAVLRCIAD
ncbi:MAG: haloacid dehalogenase-like hydrolase [Planctomycetes bacterium]|nr:haloacid dehalogenase-like hydrolase [Planctomycetota bacterium]